ncbi:MAG: hypothetical protein JW854_10500 [Actinobacteria bacterium]|nr:hypothetical protein [Actinomycetota bacterium]
MDEKGIAVKALVVYYSLTGRGEEIAGILEGELRESGMEVTAVALEPDPPFALPVKFLKTLMLTAYGGMGMGRKLKSLPPEVYEDEYDTVVLIGPSWGFHPAPPMTYFAREILPGIRLSATAKTVVVITCRRYWRRHLKLLREYLARSGLKVSGYLALEHQGREPLRFLAITARLAQKEPPLRRQLGRLYPPFGLSEEQVGCIHALASGMTEGNIGRSVRASGGKERRLYDNQAYLISTQEKMTLLARRLATIPYLILRYWLRGLIPTDMKEPGDIMRKYIRDYEAEIILERLGVVERDAAAAMKALTYMHNLTTKGEITEMTSHRCVRRESHCPAAGFLTQGFCRDILSGPAFRGLCEAINPDLEHIHTTYLSGGDDVCELIFEMRR